MKKINKIVLSVCCVAVSAVIFNVNNQRTMVSEVISSNVEALVAGDPSGGKKFDSHEMYVRDYDNIDNNTTHDVYWSYFYREGQQVFCANDPNYPMCGGYGYATSQKLKDENGDQMYCYW